MSNNGKLIRIMTKGYDTLISTQNIKCVEGFITTSRPEGNRRDIVAVTYNDNSVIELVLDTVRTHIEETIGMIYKQSLKEAVK